MVDRESKNGRQITMNNERQAWFQPKFPLHAWTQVEAEEDGRWEEHYQWKVTVPNRVHARA